jgi:hypothetical protein
MCETSKTAARRLEPPEGIDRNTLAVGYDRRFLSREFALLVAETLREDGALPPQRSDVQDDGIDVPLVDGVSPRRHEAGQPDPCAAAADGIGEIDVRLALLKGRIAEVARAWIEVEGVESVAGSREAVTADAVLLIDLFAELQLIGVGTPRRHRPRNVRRSFT